MTLEEVSLLLARIALAVAGVGTIATFSAGLLMYGLGKLVRALGYWWAFIRFYPHRNDPWWKSPQKPTPKSPTIDDPPIELDGEEDGSKP